MPQHKGPQVLLQERRHGVPRGPGAVPDRGEDGLHMQGRHRAPVRGDRGRDRVPRRQLRRSQRGGGAVGRAVSGRVQEPTLEVLD